MVCMQGNIYVYNKCTLCMETLCNFSPVHFILYRPIMIQYIWSLALLQSTDNGNNLLNNCDVIFNVIQYIDNDYYVIHSPLDKADWQDIVWFWIFHLYLDIHFIELPCSRKQGTSNLMGTHYSPWYWCMSGCVHDRCMSWFIINDWCISSWLMCSSLMYYSIYVHVTWLIQIHRWFVTTDNAFLLTINILWGLSNLIKWYCYSFFMEDTTLSRLFW